MTDEQGLEAALQAMALVGTSYRYGGNTPESGFDCSGLIGYVYQRAASITPPRSVRLISAWGQAVPATHARTGDLVIFGVRGNASHAGVYVGQSRFVHAPSTGGTVRLNSIREAYWAARLMMYRRPAGGQGIYIFSRQPVLKIQATMPRQIAMNSTVMARLIPTPTSAVP